MNFKQIIYKNLTSKNSRAIIQLAPQRCGTLKKGGRTMLTAEETDQLVSLLKKLTWPLDSRVFGALLNKTVSVPIELAVLNDKNEVLMFYRKDDEYDGNHMPGSVLRDTDTIEDVLERLRKGEVVGGNVTSPICIGLAEISKGSGSGQNPTRHEISLIYLCRLVGEYRGSGKFYPLEKLPEDTLSHHRVLVGRVKRYLSRPIHRPAFW